MQLITFPATVVTFGGKVTTVAGIHDAASWIPTTVINFGGSSSSFFWGCFYFFNIIIASPKENILGCPREVIFLKLLSLFTILMIFVNSQTGSLGIYKWYRWDSIWGGVAKTLFFTFSTFFCVFNFCKKKPTSLRNTKVTETKRGPSGAEKPLFPNLQNLQIFWQRFPQGGISYWR